MWLHKCTKVYLLQILFMLSSDCRKNHYFCRMVEIENIWIVIAAYLPFFSVTTWVLILLLSLQHCITNYELRVKRALLYFFLTSTVSWLSVAAYYYQPLLFADISIISLTSYILCPILYYRFVWMITGAGNEKVFPRWHYLAPGIILFGALVWAFFTPLSIRRELIMDRYVIYPSYELYSYIYLCKPIIQPLIAVVYCVLALWRLLSYYRVINNGVKVVDPPKMWITLLMGTLVNIVAINILTLILPKMAAMTSSIAFALMMVFIVLYFILGYKVVCLEFLLYVIDLHDKTTPRIPEITKLKPIAPPKDIIPGKPRKKRIAEVVINKHGREVTVPLTSKRFESYMHTAKPYLDPLLKITDLIEPLKANRTVLSNFVNQTYGMNFNQYINHLRLTELRRLMQLPSNTEKKLSEVLPKAGFSNTRNYNRAVTAEQERKGDKKTKIVDTI